MNTTKGSFAVDENGRPYWSAAGSSTASTQGGASTQIVSAAGAYTGKLERNDAVPIKPVAAMSFGQRVRVGRLFESHEEFIGQVIRVAGWAKSTRAQKDFVFVELNDGSCFSSI